MSDEEQGKITDDTLLSELTVGEFKQLMSELLADVTPIESKTHKIEPPIEKVPMRRKSLDEFMSDLGDKTS